MLDAAAGELTANTAGVLHTRSFATYEAFACKKKNRTPWSQTKDLFSKH